jgi:type I restriction enzyme S subunit
MTDPSFLELFFRSPIVLEQINDSSRRTSVINLHMEKIKELIVILPTLEEQKDIVAAYRKTIASVSQLRHVTQLSGERLREFRSALITAAATGQIDVATWRKRGTTDRSLEAIEYEVAS